MKRISLRIMLAIIICSITTSTILFVVSIKRTSSVMSEETERMLSYASKKYSNQLSIYFKNAEGLVDSLAADVSVTFDLSVHKADGAYFNEYEAYLHRIIKEMLQYSDIANGLYFTFNPELTFPIQKEVWYAFDGAGIPQAVTPDLSLNARNFTEPVEDNMLYYFQPILEKKGTWTGPYIDSDVNLEMLSYSRAVYVDGVLVGVAGADILTEDTIDIVKTMKIYPGSSSFLFDDKKTLTASSNGSDHERYSEIERQIQEYAEVEDSGVIHYSVQDGEYLLAFSKLSNGWILGISQPTREVFSPARGLILVLTLLTLICIALTVIFGVYFSRRLSKPIVDASDQLMHLKTGDYTHAIPREFLNRKDDIGEFHNAILSIQSEMKKEAELNREKDILLIYQSKQAKIGEMVGNISHQWKQPLNTINLILLNLYEDYQLKELTDEELKATVDKLMNIVRNMSETIKDFTDFLKPNKEAAELFDLRESVDLALDLMEASLTYHKITVEVNVDQGLKLLGYQNEFSHVLFNILNNARDAILESNVEQRLIQINGRREGENVLLEIINRGELIPDETLGKLFEPYFTTKNEKDGTGIGLYISKIIIEQRMKGHIELENVDSGVCCRICVKTEKEELE